LPGSKILPELLRDNRRDYVKALRHADNHIVDGHNDLKPLHALLTKLLEIQLADTNGNQDAKDLAAKMEYGPKKPT
jgi:hypothetical protein